MSYVASFPKKYRGTAWLFRSVSKLWYTDKVHMDTCRCDGCWLGPKGQLELRFR